MQARMRNAWCRHKGSAGTAQHGARFQIIVSEAKTAAVARGQLAFKLFSERSEHRSVSTGTALVVIYLLIVWLLYRLAMPKCARSNFGMPLTYKVDRASTFGRFDRSSADAGSF